MRIDKFLNTTNVLKRRSLAKDLMDNNLVSVNGNIVKSSKLIKIGDIIEIKFLEYTKKYEVLALPEFKNIKKDEKQNYVKEF